MPAAPVTSRIFFDASALFAAAYLAGGGSRELVRLAIRGEIELVTSDYALEEARRNLVAKAPKALDAYDLLLSLLELELAYPSPKEVAAAEEYVAEKDAPIISAGKKAEVNYLVSYDEEHLLGNAGAAEYAGTTIGTAGDALAAIRGK